MIQSLSSTLASSSTKRSPSYSRRLTYVRIKGMKGLPAIGTYLASRPASVPLPTPGPVPSPRPARTSPAPGLVPSPAPGPVPSRAPWPHWPRRP
ncbi:unnamed protein product [Closterium sp. NIES-54]